MALDGVSGSCGVDGGGLGGSCGPGGSGGPGDGAGGVGGSDDRDDGGPGGPGGLGEAHENPEVGNHAGTQGPGPDGTDYADGSPYGGRDSEEDAAAEAGQARLRDYEAFQRATTPRPSYVEAALGTTLAGRLATAGGLALLDGPQPGPMDVAAAGLAATVLGKAVHDALFANQTPPPADTPEEDKTPPGTTPGQPPAPEPPKVPEPPPEVPSLPTTVDELKARSQLQRETMGSTRVWNAGPGGRPGMDQQFDALDLRDVKEYDNGVRVGTLPDGRRVVARPMSTSDQRPSLDLQRPDGRTTDKFRYDD